MVCSMAFFVDGTSNTQINRVVSHPTMSLLITTHEDKYLRIFDLATGQLQCLSLQKEYS